jgi:hypothetical protein
MAKWKPGKSVLARKMGTASQSDIKRGGKARYKAPRAGERPYGRRVYNWGRRVRRDILLIEAWIKKQDPGFATYGDPGDPPPPPEGF